MCSQKVWRRGVFHNWFSFSGPEIAATCHCSDCHVHTWNVSSHFSRSWCVLPDTDREVAWLGHQAQGPMSDGCSVPSLSGEGDIPRSGALLGLNWARLGKKVSGQHMELLTNVPERGDFQLHLRGAGSVAPWIYFSQLLRCWCCALVTQHTYGIRAVSFIVEDFIHTSKMSLC